MRMELRRSTLMINDQRAEPAQRDHIHLIDALALQLDCFISDLRTAERLDDVKQAVYRIPEDAYSLKEWTELYTYLTKSNCALPDVSAIKADLVTFTMT